MWRSVRVALLVDFCAFVGRRRRAPVRPPSFKYGEAWRLEMISIFNSKDHRWRDSYNPLRGLNMCRLVSMLEAGERGQYADLQWFYYFMERSDAMIASVIQRRRAALLSVDWDIRLVAGRDEGGSLKAEIGTEDRGDGEDGRPQTADHRLSNAGTLALQVGAGWWTAVWLRNKETSSGWFMMGLRISRMRWGFCGRECSAGMRIWRSISRRRG